MPIKSNLKLWHPWPLPQLELLQGTDFTNPYCQRFSQTYVIGTVQSGSGMIKYRDTNHRITAGSFYVIEPGELWGCQSTNLTFQHLFVEPALLQHVAANIAEGEKPWPRFAHPGILDASLGKTLRDLYARSTTPASQLQQQELLLHALTRLLLSHAEGQKEPRRLGWERPAIKRIKAYLEEHYAEEISLDELSRVAYLSAFHLSRAFHQAVGLPPHAYQMQIRIARSKTLLARGFPVGYVASETGFFDQAHFTHQFKRNVGVTPGTYLKSARFYNSNSVQ